MRQFKDKSMFTVDVEDWFHILGHPAVPTIDQWDGLESRIERNVNRLLELFSKYGVRATFFWLGWAAERNKTLVNMCIKEGHEVASHGYAHLLIGESGREIFKKDISLSKKVLEDITGLPVSGFRAAGFSITDRTRWALDIIKEADFKYDSSISPRQRGNAGIADSELVPHAIQTQYGSLIESPMSVAEIAGRRYSVFGGGNLRKAPLWLIRFGIRNLRSHDRPLIVYIHPREIDPGHPRLSMGFKGNFNCYANLRTTFGKLEWLCRHNKFVTMGEYVLAN